MGIASTGFKFGLSALAVADPFLTYSSYKKEGRSTGSAMAMAGAELVAWGVAPGAMGLKMLGDLGGMMLPAIDQYGRTKADSMGKAYQANFGGTYRDTQVAATMRQRGVQAIQQSRMNTRSVLGSEARMYGR